MNPTTPSNATVPDIRTFGKKQRPIERAKPLIDHQQGRHGGKLLFGILGLLLGVALGGLVARAHYKGQAEGVVVAVNGATLNQKELNHRLELTAGKQVVQQWIAEQTLLEFARKKGVYPGDSAVETEWKKLTKQPHFAQTLAAQGETEQDVKRTLRLQLAREAIAAQDIQVTPAEAESYYRANIDPKNPRARFYTPPTCRISVIVTRKEADAKKARQALNQGEQFAAVASAYSEDASRKNGGELAPILRGRTNIEKIPGLEDAIFRLNVGDLLGPKRYAGLWWIVRGMDRSPAATAPFEDVEEECLKGARLQKGLARNSHHLQSEQAAFEKSVAIQVFSNRYQSVVPQR